MTMSTALLMLHICGAVIGLISGFMAMLFRKGSGLHAVAGNVFFIAMLCMSASGAYIAQFDKPNKANFLVATLTFYLVSTAWMAARRRQGTTGIFDRLALLVVAADGTAGIIWGLQAVSSAAGTKDGMPAPIYFIFGTIALLCAVSDVRMLARGGITGAKRIARHLLRMSTALLIATMSLYPGQAKLFPDALRETNLLFIPHVLLIGSMLFYMVRVRRTKTAARVQSTGAVLQPAAAAR
ncbi:MAG TPA: hypothetical protein VE974_05505 [Thermoanaerobaculia bacterium]|nr:hypothetical protein [Thermoanaerobaculia bacterium]